jgi:hypothetical protein
VTASVLVFDAYVPGDEALANSRFIAERTAERLGDDAVALTHPDAVRAKLEDVLALPAIVGLALFGHGEAGRLHVSLRLQHRDASLRRAALDEGSDAGAVKGSDRKPALDLKNLPLLRGRWCHATACNVGLELAHRAVDVGVSCFVAYETSLTPEYDADALPPPLREHLVEVVTSTTLHLHRGVRHEAVLKERVQQAIEALEGWLDGDEGSEWVGAQDGYMHVAGIRGLAHQMRRDMVVRTAPPRDPAG